jgi:hypothetical protein
MFARKRLPVWALVVVLILALAGLGLGYAHWTLRLFDQGTVTTGSFTAEWQDAFTDDDDIDDPGDKDLGDDGFCLAYMEGGEGSCDPVEAGPMPSRNNTFAEPKDVGKCTVDILRDSEGNRVILDWKVENGYPSYYCTVWGHIANTGSVPMRIYHRALKNPNPNRITTGFAVDSNQPYDCGYQIDPGESLQVGMWIHVEQAAEPGGNTYTGSSEYRLVNWNEAATVLDSDGVGFCTETW